MPTFSIVTGNGFTGNAQRVSEPWNDNYIFNYQFQFENFNYNLSFKYRSNLILVAVFADGLSTNTSVIDSCTVNQGLAITKTINNFSADSFAGTYLGFDIDTTGLSSVSNNSMTIPTSHPTTVTFTIGTGLAFLPDMTVRTTSQINGAYFDGVVTSYNSGTGSVTVESVSNSAGGTWSSWNITVLHNIWYEIDEVNLTLA